MSQIFSTAEKTDKGLKQIRCYQLLTSLKTLKKF